MGIKGKEKTVAKDNYYKSCNCEHVKKATERSADRSPRQLEVPWSASLYMNHMGPRSIPEHGSVLNPSIRL